VTVFVLQQLGFRFVVAAGVGGWCGSSKSTWSGSSSASCCTRPTTGSSAKAVRER